MDNFHKNHDIQISKKAVILKCLEYLIDINVSLAMGAKIIMIGGMLSAFKDSPGNIVTQNDVQYKEFWGSASQYQSNKTNRIEGTKILKVMKNKNLIDELVSIEESIQSGISYAGGKDLTCFNNINFIIL